MLGDEQDHAPACLWIKVLVESGSWHLSQGRSPIRFMILNNIKIEVVMAGIWDDVVISETPLRAHAIQTPHK